MSKKIRNLKRMPPRAKTLAISPPAVLAALALLGTSLRITDAPGANVDGSAQSGPKATGTKLAAGAKFTTTTKNKVDTYLQYELNNTSISGYRRRSDKHKTPMPSPRSPNNILGK